MADPVLVAFVVLAGLPVLGAILVRALPARAADGLAAGVATIGAAVAVALVAVYGMSGVWVPLGGLAAVDRAFGHPVPLFGFRLDALASFVLLGNALIGVACVAYSAAYVGPGNRELPASDDRRAYYAWLLVFIGAMAGLAT